MGLTYFDIHPDLPIIDMLAAVGVVRQTCMGGAPTKSDSVAGEHRRNVARNGQTFDVPAQEAALIAIAFAKTAEAAVTPDLIADQAILTVSAWQRETSQQMADRLLPLWQARKHLPPADRLNDNHQDHYGATLDAVRLAVGDSNASV